MNESTKYELAETLSPMTDEQRQEFIDGMADTPSAEDLAAIEALIADVAAKAEAETVTEDAEVAPSIM